MKALLCGALWLSFQLGPTVSAAPVQRALLAGHDKPDGGTKKKKDDEEKEEDLQRSEPALIS